MSVQEVALVVAAIGFSGTLVTSLLTIRATRRNAFVRELRMRTAEAFTHIFVLQHAIEWVTWHAIHDPGSVTSKTKADYSAEAHAVIPRILGAMASLASLSMDVYSATRPILEELYALDSEVGRAMVGLDSSDSGRRAAVDRLSKHYDKAYKLYETLPRKFGEAVGVAIRSGPASL